IESSNFSSVSVPSQSLSQLARGGKSKVSFGIKKPRFAAGRTIINPIKPPTNDGNSGPKYLATKKYGMVKLRPAKIANGQTFNPSTKERLAPKNRVKKPLKINGIKKPTSA